MGALWAPKSEGVGLRVRAISFRDFQCMWSWSTNVTDRQTDRQTDRRTDRRTTCDRNTALCTIVHRAVKNNSLCACYLLRYEQTWSSRDCLDRLLSPIFKILVLMPTISVSALKVLGLGLETSLWLLNKYYGFVSIPHPQDSDPCSKIAQNSLYQTMHRCLRKYFHPCYFSSSGKNL